MFYSIRHITKFIYSSPVSESITEIRMQPRSEANQRCIKFELTTQPRARVQGYKDYLGNVVHYFDIPGQHGQLKITAEAAVEITPPPPLPEALSADAWAALDAAKVSGEYWDSVAPSQYAAKTERLSELITELKIERRDDPLSLMREINTAIFDKFDYSPQTTSVDSPIDHALEERKGVCQDFAHIMIALLREVGIPCRYVSGYLFHGHEHHDRSAADATHAWIEAFLPDFGWIGFDPTNNLLTGERHIRTAIGRDYADVPPTRGVFRGSAQTELSVGVQVLPTEAPLPEEEMISMTTWITPPPTAEDDYYQQQQQQQ
ncbi:MAG: transglutaminase family protein [Acidobacteria bacterium]|nr:transglutaminase family protein [Acidobacteriota bacterium]